MTAENNSFNSLLKFTFGAHAVVALIFGVPLLLAPGQFLGYFDWSPIDPLLSRILGAALIGLAWSSVRGFMANYWSQVSITVEAEIVFCVLGCIGILRHLLISGYPWMVWLTFGTLLIFAVLWIASYLTNR